MTEHQINSQQADEQSRVLGMAALWLSGDVKAFDLAVSTVQDYQDAHGLLMAAQGTLKGMYAAVEVEAPEELSQPAPEGELEIMQSLMDVVGAICVVAETTYGMAAQEMLRLLSMRAAYESAGMAS